MDSRISLKKLEILCLVVEFGGVGKAAEQLQVSQPVVTAHMRSLQDRLGVELLYRDGQQMRLTEQGQAVYEWAREVLGRGREVTSKLQQIATDSAGAVVVGSSMSVGSYVLPRVVGWFCDRQPEARVTLQVSDCEEAQRATEGGECDFAVLTTGSPLVDEALRARRVGSHDLVLVASPDESRVGETAEPAQLARLPFVCSPAGPRRRLVDDALAEFGIARRQVVIELGHPEALKTVTRMGAGVALLWRASVEEELRSGVLREVPIAGLQLKIPIMIVHRADKCFTPIQRQLLEAIAAALRDVDPATVKPAAVRA
jgi:LysR family transcriptional regulator, low CO2-responsive transcriptional regulator